MKQFICTWCNQTITFGVEIKGVGEISDAIRSHEQNCACNDSGIIIPVSVRKLKNGKSRILKLTSTVFDPSSAIEGLKNSVADLKVIFSELSDKELEESAGALHDLIIDLETEMKNKYLWK